MMSETQRVTHLRLLHAVDECVRCKIDKNVRLIDFQYAFDDDRVKSLSKIFKINTKL